MLAPMSKDDAADLMETKFQLITADEREQSMRLYIDAEIIERVVVLSGGHPHLLQLLGSYLVENENANPDGMIDAQDLTTALRRICYEDRAEIYTSLIHKLEIEDQLVEFQKLLAVAPATFPTFIRKSAALEVADSKTLQWMFEHNILSSEVNESYRLIDEFLRIRLLLDAAEEEDKLEQKLLDGSWTLDQSGQEETEDY